MIDLKSWNPWHGCRKYSEGCANCYMFVLDKAHKVPGQSTEIFRTRNFSKPLERDRKGNFKVPPGYWVRVNFAFDSTGEVFIKDGRSYRIPDQKMQLHQAFRSGLSHYFGPIRFNLYDPEYGTLLAEEELFHPRYNLHRCAECTMAFACAGFGNCGRCKEVELVDLNIIWVPE